MPNAITVSTARPGWARAVGTLLRRLPPRAGTHRLVAVDGRSGAGKTGLAAALAAEFDAAAGPADAASVVHLDDLYPGWDGLAAAAPLVRSWLVDPLLRGAVPRLRRYDWERGAHGPWESTPVGGLVLIEGCGAGARELRPFLTALVWVRAPDGVRADRLDRRGDAAEYAPHRQRWARQEDAFAAVHRPERHAHIVVDNG